MRAAVSGVLTISCIRMSVRGWVGTAGGWLLDGGIGSFNLVAGPISAPPGEEGLEGTAAGPLTEEGLAGLRWASWPGLPEAPGFCPGTVGGGGAAGVFGVAKS